MTSFELRFIFYDLCVIDCLPLSLVNESFRYIFKKIYIYILGGMRARDSVASSLHESNSSLRLFLTICFFLNVEPFSLCDCVYLGRWFLCWFVLFLLSYRTG